MPGFFGKDFFKRGLPGLKGESQRFEMFLQGGVRGVDAQHIAPGVSGEEDASLFEELAYGAHEQR